MKFNWQLPDWPQFKYDTTRLQATSSQYSEKLGALKSLLSLFDARIIEDKAIIQLTNEAVDTSAIEGVRLDRDAVMSSVCRQLGRTAAHARAQDEAAEGFASLILDARNTYSSNLTKQMLLRWHTSLFKGQHGTVPSGRFRTHNEPMMVLGGGIEGNEIRFVAPPSSQVGNEMTRFVKWFNTSQSDIDSGVMHPAARIAIAHLYFESIHPFEDGNGRIGRMLVCKALAQNLGMPVLLPVSVAIRKSRAEYYNAIHEASLTNDVTDWCLFFTGILTNAMTEMSQELAFLVKKIQFFDEHSSRLNARQSRVLQRMTAEGHHGFAGGMNAAKYQKIAKTSKATATRDLTDLNRIGALLKTGAGPRVRYHLPFANS